MKGRPQDAIYVATSEVIDRLQQDAGCDLRTAKAAERRRFIDAFVSVIVREARKHGAPHDKGEPCVFSPRGPTKVGIAATRMLADRLRKHRRRAKSVRLHRPDKPGMSDANQRQLTERPIEVALRKAGRRVPPRRSGRPWDRPPVGFAGAIQDALEETKQMAKESWRDEVDYVPDWFRLPPATDKRVARTGDRAMRNAPYFDLVTKHLLSPVTHETGENEDQDDDKARLAEGIRRKYFETLGTKVRQIGDIEARRWAEVEFGGPLDTSESLRPALLLSSLEHLLVLSRST